MAAALPGRSLFRYIGASVAGVAKRFPPQFDISLDACAFEFSQVFGPRFIGFDITNTDNELRAPHLNDPATRSDCFGQFCEFVCNRVIDAAALLGYEFNIDVLRSNSMGWAESELFESLESLADCGLIVQGNATVSRQRFVHGLVHDALLVDMSVVVKLDLHARIADALESLYSGSRYGSFREVYRHYKDSGSDDEYKLSELVYKAGNEAFENYSYDDAYRLYNEGLEYAVRLRDDSACARYQAALARVGMHISSVASVSHLYAAFELYADQGEFSAISELIRTPEIAMTVKYASLNEIRPIEALVRHLPEDPNVHILYGQALAAANHDSTEALAELTRARKLAEAYGDTEAEMYACYASFWQLHHTGRFGEAEEPVLRALDLARDIGNLFIESEARRCQIALLDKTARSEEAIECREKYARWARATKDPSTRIAAICTVEAGIATATCDTSRLKALIDEYAEISYAAGTGARLTMSILIPAQIAFFEGDTSGIAKFIDYLGESLEARQLQPPPPLHILSYLAILTSSVPYAQLLASSCTGSIETDYVRARELIEWYFLSDLGVACALLGRFEEAYKHLSDIDAGRADSGWIRTGLIAYLLGDYEDAIERFERFAHNGLRTSALLLIADVALSDAKLRVGNAEQRREAVADLQRVLEITRTKRLPLFERYVCECVKRHGISGLDPGDPELIVNPAGLTPREIEVIRLVADGLINKEIAFELQISVRTVHRHVGNILRKTMSGNRTEAARFAERHGLTV